MAQSIFYPAAGANSPVDGAVRRDAAAGEDYGTIRGSAGTSAYPSVDQTSSAEVYCHASTADKYIRIARSIYLFNTGPTIPANAVIDSVTLSLYGSGYKGNDIFTASQAALALVNATPASNSNLASADYGQVGTTRLATDIAYANWIVNDYNPFTLNAAGIAAIAKGSGVSKFGIRIAGDLDNNTPTWKAGGDAFYNAYYADKTGTTYDPKLIVNWHLAATVAVTNKSLTVVRYTPGIVAGTSKTIAVTPKALTVSAKTVEVIALSGGTPATVDITPVALSVSTKTPTVVTGHSATVSVTPIALSVNTKTPTVSGAATVNVTPVALVVTTHIPVVVAGHSAVVSITPVQLSVSKKTPQVSAAYTTTIPPPIPLEVATHTPTVQVGTGAIVNVVPKVLSVSVKTVEVIALTAVIPATIDIVPLALEVTKKTLTVSGAAIANVTPVNLEVDKKTPTVTGAAVISITPATLEVAVQVPEVIAGMSVTIDLTPVNLEVTTYTPLLGVGAIVNVLPVTLEVVPKIVQVAAGAVVNIIPVGLVVTPKTVKVMIMMIMKPPKMSKTGLEENNLSDLDLAENKLSKTGLN